MQVFCLMKNWSYKVALWAAISHHFSDNLPQELEISIDDKWTAEEFEEGVLLHLIQIHDFIDIRELLTKLLEAFQTRKLGSKVYLG